MGVDVIHAIHGHGRTSRKRVRPYVTASCFAVITTIEVMRIVFVLFQIQLIFLT